MNCIVRIIVVAAACTLILASPVRGATDPEPGEGTDTAFQPKVSLGFSLFYTWWKPMIPTPSRGGVFLAIAALNQGNIGGLFFLARKEVKPLTASAPIYGPSLLVRVAPRWTVSMNALYGKFIFESLDKPDVHKLEADLIVSFSVLEWFRIYGGAKYFGRINPATKSHKGGLGLGFAFNVNLYRGLYLLPNVSGIVLSDNEFLTVGVNGTLSIAYYIQKIHLTVALGGRCQYMKDVLAYDENISKMRDDLFYGPYLSLVYTF